MAKKKILKLNDEQYYKYILSLKNGDLTKNDDEQSAYDTTKKNIDEKNK